MAHCCETRNGIGDANAGFSLVSVLTTRAATFHPLDLELVGHVEIVA